MKHCPNPDCPFVQQYKMVAEFQDEIAACPDCGTPLVPGEAPEIELPSASYKPMFPENREPDLVTLCAVESEADAQFYQAKLEFQGIPAIIVSGSVEIEDDVAPEEIAPFELQVLRSDLIRATHVLDTLATSETEDVSVDDEGEYDEGEDDADDDDVDEANEDDEVKLEGGGTDNDEAAAPSVAAEPSAEPLSSVRAQRAVGMPTMYADEADVKPTRRFNQLTLVIAIAVVVILVIWFLMNNFGQ